MEQHFKTRSQAWAERAYHCIIKRAEHTDSRGDYCRFAKRFPSLIHSSGLAQAVAFAHAKNMTGIIDDLASMLEQKNLSEDCRKASASEYLRLTRSALEAAGWLKRYAEAILEEKEGADASVS
jgi:CRISPR-associated protein Cmr5